MSPRKELRYISFHYLGNGSGRLRSERCLPKKTDL
jgi:hypothetical protein